MSAKSIGEVLGRWDFEPDGLGVRLVAGDDGEPKLQVRLDIGVLQLEIAGRPDGRRPHGCESLLDYHLERLDSHRRSHGTVDGFRLSAAECDALRREASQYYHRYVSLHQLGRYRDVTRDTARNLRALDLMLRHAEHESDRVELEQFRPYITMINALARSQERIDELDYPGAERVIALAVATIQAFAHEHQGRIYVGREVEILSTRLKDLQRERPTSEADLVQRQLQAAIQREDYEHAARLRDRLSRLAGEPPAALRD